MKVSIMSIDNGTIYFPIIARVIMSASTNVAVPQEITITILIMSCVPVNLTIPEYVLPIKKDIALMRVIVIIPIGINSLSVSGIWKLNLK